MALCRQMVPAIGSKDDDHGGFLRSKCLKCIWWLPASPQFSDYVSCFRQPPRGSFALAAVRQEISFQGRSLMHLNRSFLKGPAKIVGTFLGSLVLLLVFGVTTHAQSNVYTNWTAQYRPGELPVAIVADGQGNTYVTGSVVVCFQSSTNGCQTSGTESVTIKYDSHGQTVWRAFLTASPATDPNLGGAHGTG